MAVIVTLQMVRLALRQYGFHHFNEILKQVVEMGVVIGVVIVDILLIFRVEIRFFALIPLGVLA